MKRIVYNIFFTILICLLPGKSYCQKICNNNFTNIAKAYLEHAKKKYKLDTASTIFIASTWDSEKNEFFFEIIFMDTTFLSEFEYDNIYSLGIFKLITSKGFDKSSRLTGVFKKKDFEIINKSRKIVKYGGEGFHKWVFLMNEKCEIMQVNGRPPEKKFIEDMKKYKLIFAKDPY